MPGLSGSPLLQRSIDVQYAARKRSAAAKWTLVNGTLLVIFACDLWCKCPGYTSPLHVVELCVASALAASLLLHARWLLPARERALDVTARQLHLLGLTDQQLDSSFRLVDTSGAPSPSPDTSHSLDDDVSVLSLSLSLSQSRGGGGGGGGSPGGGAGGGGTGAGGEVSWARAPEDQFLADSDSLTDYLRQYAARAAAQTPPPPAWLPPAPAGGYPPARARHYQLSSLDAECPAGGAGAEGGAGGGGGEPRVWRRLDLDPHHLTQYNLNLRLWLHVTILARLVREVDSINDALHKHHLPDVTIGEVSVERLRRTAAALGGAGVGAGGAGGALHTLLPYLEPFPEQRYLLQRIRELSTGGCLGQYKWDRGGSDWDDTKPTDSEIIFHLFTTYVESQFGGGAGVPAGAGAGVGVCAVGAGGVGAAPPRVVRAAPLTHPPHYLLQLKDETIEVCRGRNNLLHTLLVWVAAAAAARAAGRLQLGAAGLNLLWVIGR